MGPSDPQAARDAGHRLPRRAVWRWLLLGFVLRWTLMPFTLHDDLLFIHAFPALLWDEGVLDVYRYLQEHYAGSIGRFGWFYYPPLVYYTMALVQAPVRALVPGFGLWMGATREAIAAGGTSTAAYLALAGTGPLFRAILLMKLPYLAFDLLTGVLLLRLGDGRAGATAFRLWMVNPVVIYSAFLFGQFDVMGVLFLTVSLVAAQRGRPGGAMLALGVAAGFKNIPLLAIPPAALLLGETSTARARLLLLGLLPYVAVFLPLYVTSGGFVWHAVVPPVIGRIARTGRLALLWKAEFLVGYLLVLGHAWLAPRPAQPLRALRTYILVVFLLAFSATPISFHWFVWAMPLVVLAVAEKRALWPLCAAQIVALAVSSLLNRALWGGLLAPLHPAFFGALPGPEALVDGLMPPDALRKAAGWAFKGFSLLLMVRLARDLFGQRERAWTRAAA